MKLHLVKSKEYVSTKCKSHKWKLEGGEPEGTVVFGVVTVVVDGLVVVVEVVVVVVVVGVVVFAAVVAKRQQRTIMKC